MLRVQWTIRVSIYLVSMLCVMAFITSAHAQVVVDNIADTSLGRYETRFEFIGNQLSGLMLNTFYLLAVIEFSWAIILVFIHNTGLQGFLSTVVTRVLFIGFFSWLLGRGGQSATDIFRSFEDLAIATTLTDGALTPSNIIDKGNILWSRLYNEATSIGVFDIIFDPDKSLSTPVLLIFIGMIVLMVMTVIAAHFAVVLLETFIAASAGIILLALGATRWTYKYATRYLMYAMSVGMKLFVLTIIVGLTIDEINRFFLTAAIDEINNLMSLLAFMIFTMILAILVPKSVKGMMDGVSVGSATGAARGIVSRSTGQIGRRFLS